MQLLTMFHLFCTKQLLWKILMSSPNQHDTVKTMFCQLTGTFGRTEPTVSYDSMPTTMIWLIQSDIGCFWCPKGLNSLAGIGSLPSYNSRFKTICEAAFARFLTSFPRGLDFRMILILLCRFLWNDFIIFSANVM